MLADHLGPGEQVVSFSSCQVDELMGSQATAVVTDRALHLVVHRTKDVASLYFKLADDVRAMFSSKICIQLGERTILWQVTRATAVAAEEEFNRYLETA